jgi:hypothetical protein
MKGEDEGAIEVIRARLVDVDEDEDEDGERHVSFKLSSLVRKALSLMSILRMFR